MGKIIKIIDKISDLFGSLAGIMMLFGFALVLVEILLRTFLSKTLYITGEYTGYIMTGITFLGLAYTLKENGHIRMTFLHSFLKGRKVVFLDIFTSLAGLIFFAVLTYITAEFTLGSLEIGSRSMQISRTLLAIPQSFIPMGCFIMVLQFLGEILKSFENLRTGAWEKREIETRITLNE